ncbi:MAG TPA: hypothetical protein PKE45_09210, partial [Caldilineaceae bacterium]|nr:hypothetical protein [Caldilineaceae bacterium]
MSNIANTTNQSLAAEGLRGKDGSVVKSAGELSRLFARPEDKITSQQPTKQKSQTNSAPVTTAAGKYRIGQSPHQALSASVAAGKAPAAKEPAAKEP